MTQNSCFARLVAFAVSAAVVLSAVVVITQHGLPVDGSTLLTQAANATRAW